VVKGIEPPIGYGPILTLSEIEAEMRNSRVKRTKTVCTYCAVGCSFDVWTRDRHILKIRTSAWPGEWDLDLREGQVCVGAHQLRRPAYDAAAAGWRGFPRGLVGRGPRCDEAKFKKILKEDGPDALAFIASSKCTNEESFLMQKLARR